MNDEQAVVDLRSDTVTKPTEGMRRAMFEAEVGDDMVGEDPTVNALEAYCQELFQKPAAVYCCSGTQSNQAAIWSHCHPGDAIVIEQKGHLANYEGGAPAALAGVTSILVPGEGGMLDREHMESCLKPREQHFPWPRVLCLENTTNIGGGRAYPLDQLERATGWARENDLKCHLDGARLFNACVSQSYRPDQVARLFDTVSICFSKGLGCPMGSMLVGDEQIIKRARRARKLFGGALRQAGVVAASALYALRHHRNRLAEDHQNARRLAEKLAQIPGLSLNVDHVETNVLFAEVDRSRITPQEFSQRAAQKGVKFYAIDATRVRFVTHLDITEEMVDRAAQILHSIMLELDSDSIWEGEASSSRVY